MGFGTFFIGYFFLINITYYEYTDIVSAMIMLLGLYNLSRFNREFKISFVASSVFALFSMAEFIISAIKLFDSSFLPAFNTSNLAIPRYILIFGITVSLLMGINSMAKEVEAYSLAKRASYNIPWCAIYITMAICEISKIGELLGAAMPYVYLAVLLGHVILIISVLITVYKAYATICMPEDLEKEQKRSKFNFIDKIQERNLNFKNRIRYIDKYFTNNRRQNI